MTTQQENQNAVKEEVEKDTEEKKANEKFAQTVREIEQAVFHIKFYPVAVDEEAKNAAKDKIKEIYKKENETIKQLILYMIHEALSQIGELKTIHNFETFKKKFPTAEPAQLRMHVYKAIFNYNSSLEGLIELINLLSELDGYESTKVLTYYFSFLSSTEVESAHILRNAIIDALGRSNSVYALKSLLEYAKYTDNEKLLQHIYAALVQWSARLEMLKIPKKEKEKLQEELRKIFISEFASSHYR
jgi:hypothetical protein